MKLNSEKIKFLIADRGMNMSEFSEHSGISRAWLSNVLSRETCTGKFAKRIAKNLDVELKEIITLNKE